MMAKGRRFWARSHVRECLNNALVVMAGLLLAGVAWAAADNWATAIQADDLSTVEVLLDRGADVNVATENGKTALMSAAKLGHRSLMEALLRGGADINAVNHNGGTALMYAALGGDLEAVRYLLKRGAKLDAASMTGWSALTVAAAKGHADIVGFLLGRGSDVNVTDIYGWTPLMRAVEQRKMAVVSALLKQAGVVLDARNEFGASALHRASAKGFVEIAELLLDHGADPALTDSQGRDAVEIARLAGHSKIVVLLRERPARRAR